MPLRRDVGLGPSDIVLDGYPALPKKGAQPPIFGPCLLWPNGWMDQDATWYEGRPRPRPHCVTWGSGSPKGAQLPTFRPMSIVAKRSPISATAEHLFQCRLFPNIIYGAVLPLPFISPYASLSASSRKFVNVQRL